MVSLLMFREAAPLTGLLSSNCGRRDRKNRMKYFVKNELFFREE